MKKKLNKFFLILLFLPGLAAADSTALLKQMTDQQDQTHHWNGSLLLGYNASTGNTQTNNYLAKFNISYNRKLWENTFNASIERAMSDQKTTAKKASTDYTSRWLFDKENYTYLNTGYIHDEFAPYIDTTNVGWGYGWRPVNNDKVLIQLQTGPGYQYTKAAENESNGKQKKQHTFTANGKVDLTWRVNKHFKFTQSVGTVLSRQNCYYTITTAITTSLIGHLALQVSYNATHNTQVPRDSKRAHTDTNTQLALVYAF